MRQDQEELEHFRAEARDLRSRLGELKIILSSIRQGYWELDRLDHVVDVNPFLESWLGYAPDEMLHQAADNFVLQRSPLITDGGKPAGGQFEVVFRAKDGERRHAIVVSGRAGEGPNSRRIEVVTDVTGEHALRARLLREVSTMADLAHRDPLTGLANRRGYERAVRSGIREGKPFGLLILDLDGFKKVNDRAGHAAGDRLLVRFAQLLRKEVRAEDLPARVGGDEFAVYLEGLGADATREVAERLVDRMRMIEVTNGETVEIGASVGWAHSSEKATDLHDVADRRMYLQKAQGRE
jgi:diguanylate cyclase (GGDEF)-like protein